MILANQLFVKIAFVGPHLDKVVAFLDNTSRQVGNSFVVLHYAPSILTIRHNLTAILFPDCKDPLILRPKIKPECLYTANRLAKIAWKPVQSRAQELFNFLENFSFEYEEYIELLTSYNTMMKMNTSTENSLEDVACAWLKHNHTSHLYDHNTKQRHARQQAWYNNFPIRIKNQLYIGGIFPVTGSKFTAPELGPGTVV